MENTVTISLNEYNELRDFKNKISEGYTISINKLWPYNKYLSTDEALLQITKEYEKEIENIERERDKEIKKLKEEINEDKNIRIALIAEKDEIIKSLNEKLNKKSFSFKFWKRKK